LEYSVYKEELWISEQVFDEIISVRDVHSLSDPPALGPNESFDLPFKCLRVRRGRVNVLDCLAFFMVVPMHECPLDRTSLARHASPDSQSYSQDPSSFETPVGK